MSTATTQPSGPNKYKLEVEGVNAIRTYTVQGSSFSSNANWVTVYDANEKPVIQVPAARLISIHDVTSES